MIFDDFINLLDDKKENKSNAESVKTGSSVEPPELFSENDGKVELYTGDDAIRNEKLRLLNKCKKLSLHKKPYNTLDEAIKQASYLSVLFAEADERMYEKDLEEAEAGLENAKEGVKENRFSFSKDVKDFRKQRAEFRKRVKDLQKDRDLRGHNVEWSSVVLLDGSGKYRVVGATPGGRQRMDKKSQPADNISAMAIRKAGYMSMQFIKAEIHTHPRFGDREQARLRKDIGSSGLSPSNNDRTERGVQAMVNQRGKIVRYGEQEDDKVLDGGISKEDIKKDEFGAMTAIKQGENKDKWKQDIDEITGVLEEVDRKKIKEFQETIG